MKKLRKLTYRTSLLPLHSLYGIFADVRRAATVQMKYKRSRSTNPIARQDTIYRQQFVKSSCRGTWPNKPNPRQFEHSIQLYTERRKYSGSSVMLTDSFYHFAALQIATRISCCPGNKRATVVNARREFGFMRRSDGIILKRNSVKPGREREVLNEKSTVS